MMTFSMTPSGWTMDWSSRSITFVVGLKLFIPSYSNVYLVIICMVMPRSTSVFRKILSPI